MASRHAPTCGIPIHAFRWIGVALAVLVLTGCYPMRDTSRPPAVRRLAAIQPAQRLVVVFPGIADNLRSLEAGGIGREIRKEWSESDVLLVEMTIGYYKGGRAMPDLHDLVKTAREQGYQEVWLVGASLGGMGALLYDATFPCEVDGIVLLAPFLGDRRILNDVRNAGGLSHWPAPPAAPPDRDNWQEQIWRRAKDWSNQRGGDQRVWLAYGSGDKFAPNMPLLTPAVPPGHVVTGPGSHDWRSWTPLAARVFATAHSLVPPKQDAAMSAGSRACTQP